MTPAWAWPLLILGLAGWIIAAAEATAIILWVLGQPVDGPGIGPDEAYATLPSVDEKPPAPAPGTSPAQGPGIHPHYAAQLDAITKRRDFIPPGTADAARIVADGLRTEFPALDDLTLGLVTVHLYGYARSLTIGLPEPIDAAQTVVDLFGLTAEDLTRIARMDTPR
jgi:hypothetical protein